MIDINIFSVYNEANVKGFKVIPLRLFYYQTFVETVTLELVRLNSLNIATMRMINIVKQKLN